MKIKKNVWIDKVYEFEITAKDLIEDMKQNQDTADGIKDACNKFFVYLSSVSDSSIAGIIDKDRKIIEEFFTSQASRFATKGGK
jgi:hypothetical protein